MLKQIKKPYLLPAGTAILLLICYQLALKKTLAAWQVSRQLKAQVLRSADLTYQPAYLERKNANLGKLLARFRADTLAFRSSVISALSAMAEKEHVKLSEVPLQNPQYHTDRFTIQKLTFEGDFFALLKVLHQLEAMPGTGLVRSADVRQVILRGGNTPVKKLVMDVYIEVLTDINL